MVVFQESVLLLMAFHARQNYQMQAEVQMAKSEMNLTADVA